MEKWEYKTLVVGGNSYEHVNNTLQAALDKASGEGWEFAGFTPAYIAVDSPPVKLREQIAPKVSSRGQYVSRLHIVLRRRILATQ